MAANATLMKEYVRRQLRHWLEGFKDEQLPRDFGARSFGRPQLSLTKVHLKPDKLAALLHMPEALVVTRAFCTELTIRVPSWTATDKFMQEPLVLQLGDLFIDVRHKSEIDEEQRREVERRVEAARFEPDPLGSIASMYAFATMISERLSLSVDNFYVKFFLQNEKMQVHVELSDFRARTTNALWQDMRDLSNCVERSPDSLVRTRFKFISFTCSLQLLQTKEAASSDPIKILHENAMSIRLTLFAQRNSTTESVECHSRVVDINLGALRFEHSAADYTKLCSSMGLIWRWATHTSASDELNLKSERQTLSPHDHSSGGNMPPHASFAWQITIRMSIEGIVVFTSERLGRQSIVMSAQQAVINIIVGHDGSRELQLTLDAIVVRFRGTIVLQFTPAPGTLQVKQGFPSHNSVLIRWKVKHLLCKLEGDLALILNELYHSMNEKELSATITCGTCHHKIPLDVIDVHNCSRNQAQASTHPKSPHEQSNYSTSSTSLTVRVDTTETEDNLLKTPIPIQLRSVLQLEEFELYADSHLFHNIQQLLHMNGGSYSVENTIVTKLSRIHLTTESTEFDSGAVFAPLLPLAFQLLECTIQNCGCWTLRQNADLISGQVAKSSFQNSTAANCFWVLPLIGVKVKFPERCFIDIEHGSIRTLKCQAGVHPSSADTPLLFTIEGFKMRSSFSDGSTICCSCHPQAGVHASIDRIRCQVDYQHLMHLRREMNRILSQFNNDQSFGALASTLFTCVLQVRAIEFTLKEAPNKAPQNKSLFKQIAVIIDNQLGHLVTQSTIDFRSLLNTSSLMQFVYSVTPKHPPPGMDRLRLSELSKQREKFIDAAARKIQRCPQHYRGTSRTLKTVNRSPRASTSELSVDHTSCRLQSSINPTAEGMTHTFEAQKQLEDSTIAENSTNCSQPLTVDQVQNPKQAKPSIIPVFKEEADHSSSSASVRSPTAAMLSVAEDLVNPKKMVAGAAGVLRDGFKFVRSTHQVLETEVVGLANQSLETAARLVMLPKIGIAKMSASTLGITSPRGTGEIRSADLPDKTQSSQSRESIDSPTADTDAVLLSYSDKHNELANPSSSQVNVKLDEPSSSIISSLHHDSKFLEATDNGLVPTDTLSAKVSDPVADDCDEIGGLSEAQYKCIGAHTETSEDIINQTEQDRKYVPVGISDSLFSSLPGVVRILVQVEDHRVCVPINPREKVGYLCREVVRRYNELFVSPGEVDDESEVGCSSYQLSRVALHDRFGGIFCPTDLVGHLIQGSVDTSGDTVPLLFFARPIDPETRSITPRTCISLTVTAELPRLELLKGATSTTTKGDRPIGNKFTRCSMLPLPLTVALLANESESELLRLVLTEKSCFQSNRSANTVTLDADGSWPELTLNADQLQHLLPVEVAWFGSCIEVTHIDAFVLCLQQLGMCSSQPTSRFIGRALRDRLRICASEPNPLMEAAWRRQRESVTGMPLDCELSTGNSSMQQVSIDQEGCYPIPYGEGNIDTLTYDTVKSLVQHRVGTYLRKEERDTFPTDR